MNKIHSDMTPLVNLTFKHGSGPTRKQRPTYVDLLPSCNSACPAGENIQAWLALAQAGKFQPAWEALIRDNPLPSVHGRVCYHPCETSCNRKDLDSAVSIHAVERFLGDLAVEKNWPMPTDATASGKRVLIIGAGPCGLSAAYHLTRLGHQVEIHDAGVLPGGMLHFGIPAYRLPRVDLMLEIRRIEKMGVKFISDHRVEDLLAEQRQGKFDAVLIAIGASLSKHVDIPACDAVKVVDAISLLKAADTNAAISVGRRVVVYGGGNTAMDAARTARRLGATETMIVYRRDKAHMAAHAFEADEAMAEGVKIKWLSAIKSIDGSNIKVEVMRIDDAGQIQPTGQFETIEADTVVLALGQETDSSFLRKIPEIIIQADGSVEVAPNMMTGRPGIFAGGDMIPSERSVTVATGHGKKAARYIDAWLNGQQYHPAIKHQVIEFSGLNLPIYTDAAAATQHEMPIDSRLTGFGEVVDGLDATAAQREAQRCLSCGNCFECDNCFAACPEEAILKLGPGKRYEINYALCTGCAVCVDQCPCHAMEMIPEPAAMIDQQDPTRSA